MALDWSPLRRAITPATQLWWRDDDAVAASPALEQLTQLRAETGLPLHLAIIPARIEASLVAVLRDYPALVPMVHGWAHANHAAADQKTSEFPAHRPEGV